MQRVEKCREKIKNDRDVSQNRYGRRQVLDSQGEPERTPRDQASRQRKGESKGKMRLDANDEARENACPQRG
ncbi:hypothetical protein, partial [Rhodoblastus sp.]|uniref:hypothetical protein n=1 Tax=Rhodoblastus sp. TaxID=1962975 RepID=UPI003F9B8EAC